MKKIKKVRKSKKTKITKPREYLAFVKIQLHPQTYSFTNNRDREAFLNDIQRDAKVAGDFVEYATAEIR